MHLMEYVSEDDKSMYPKVLHTPVDMGAVATSQRADILIPKRVEFQIIS